MNKLFLLPLFALFVASFSLSAQSCEPDEMLPDTVIVLPLPYQMDFPERGITDTACVDVAYETTIQLRIPATIPVGVTEVAISQVEITDQGISNLPEAFDFVCNPPNCVFLPEEPGCIQVFGTAVAEDEGIHDLKINVLITTILGAIPYSLPDGDLVPGNYFFNVKPAGSDNCATVGTTEIVENAFALTVKPNPFSDLAEINVDLPTGGNFQMNVYNAIGSLVQQQNINLNAGQNNFQFDGANLPVGMYVFTLQQGQLAASGRLLIQR